MKRASSSLIYSDGAAGPVLAKAAIGRPEHWTELALCQETDPEAFFPEKGESTRPAKRVCRACEVRSECLDYALRTSQAWGVWGGLSTLERRSLKRDLREAS